MVGRAGGRLADEQSLKAYLLTLAPNRYRDSRSELDHLGFQALAGQNDSGAVGVGE